VLLVSPTEEIYMGTVGKGLIFYTRPSKTTHLVIARDNVKTGTPTLQYYPATTGHVMIRELLLGQKMTTDHSIGWEDVADRFMTIRSGVGTALVRSWAQRYLAPSSTIVDIGCGSGIPIARGLVDDGFAVSGIDASPSLLGAFQTNFPDLPAACECAQDSTFFGRTFAGAVSVGLIFLLGTEDQRKVLAKAADAIEPAGRFLFSAPRQMCEWRDTLTGRISISLGADTYARHLHTSGLRLVDCLTDEGGNNYFDAVKAG
jgi:SAM-dependent methyltransferase